MNRMIVLATLLMIATAASATVYKWTDSDGTVHYSDQPQPGAEEVSTVPIQTYRSSPASNRSRTTRQNTPQGEAYTTLAFVSPANDATIRDNQGNVAVQLNIEPPLRNGHSIALSIDGDRQGQTVATTTFTLSNLERGTHQLQASIVDAQGSELISSGVLTVHMMRPSELFEEQNPDQTNEGPVQQAPRAPQAPRFKPDPKTSRF